MRLQAEKNFFVPRYNDTTEANLNKGIDSCGALIFSRDVNAFYYRACNPKKWTAIAGGSGSTPTLQQVLTQGSTVTSNNVITGTTRTTINQTGTSTKKSEIIFDTTQTTFGVTGLTNTSSILTLQSNNAQLQTNQTLTNGAVVTTPTLSYFRFNKVFPSLTYIFGVSEQGAYWNNGSSSYYFPLTSGTTGQVLKLTSATQLAWANDSSGGGGSTDTTSLSNRINEAFTTATKLSDTSFFMSSPSGNNDTITLNSAPVYVESPIMARVSNDSNIIFFNADTANAWRGGSSAANDTAKVVIAKVHNAETTTLQRGEVVYLFGANGDVASVKRANNKLESTSSKTFGLVRRDIAAGDTGYITTQGQIEKLNLGAFTAGDILYLDSIDGQFTNVAPVAPYNLVFLGIVERANNGNGLMYVKPINGFELSELHDVQVNGKVNNQILVYSDTQKVWKNRSAYTVIDTTKLQQKSLPAYSIMGNNTNAAANPTAVFFKDTAGVYTGSPAWNGTAPSGTTNHSFRWTRIGNMVNLSVTLIYGTGSGTNNTQVLIPLPSGCPTPVDPSGLGAANDVIYTGAGHLSTALTSLSLAGRFGVRVNAADNGYELIAQFGSGAAMRTCFINVTYQSN